MGEMYTLTRGIAISFLTCSELYSAGLKKKFYGHKSYSIILTAIILH